MSFLSKLFGSKQKEAKEIQIIAPLSGEIVNIEDVPDVVFSEKIVGDGVAIRPAGDTIVAPVNGTIGKIFETNHAFSIESEDGVELFVHFGIDTVELKGEGFTRIAEEGQTVKVGEPIIKFDLATLEAKAKSVLTPVVISNMDEIANLEKRSGSVVEGETVVDTFDYDTFRNYLNELGDSLLVVADDEIIKVHVHTERPGEVMNYGQRFGSLMKVKVDNMRMQHEEVLKTDYTEKVKAVAPKAEYGIVAVAAGEGIHELFKSMGVTTIINGGQTMNPSTEDILAAVKEAHAEKVIVLPNNKNILMAANQAAEVSEDAEVAVVASRTISEGLSSLLAFNSQASLEENKEAMTEQLSLVTSGQITNAVRDTSIDGVDIKEQDFMGIVNGKILISVPNRKQATIDTIAKMVTDESEILTILVGEDVAIEEAEEIVSYVEEHFPDIEVKSRDKKVNS